MVPRKRVPHWAEAYLDWLPLPAFAGGVQAGYTGSPRDWTFVLLGTNRRHRGIIPRWTGYKTIVSAEQRTYPRWVFLQDLLGLQRALGERAQAGATCP